MRIATPGIFKFGVFKFGFAIVGLSSLMVAQPPPPAPTPAVPAAPKARVGVLPGETYIGVMLEEIDGERAKALKLREVAGVEITRVNSDSPADKAGLKSGDAILQYNGQRVEGMEQFKRLVRETPPGRDVKLDIFRNGAPQTVTVTVAERRPGTNLFISPLPTAAPRAFEFRMPDIPRTVMSWQSSMLGIEAESLDGQLAQYFGVKEGVLVRSVSTGSSAEKAGMKAGDVIVRVDDSKVSTPADVSNRVRSLRGKPVPIVVIRDRKETPLTLTVTENGHVDGLWWRQDLGDSGKALWWQDFSNPDGAVKPGSYVIN
jgi:serine protease Do